MFCFFLSKTTLTECTVRVHDKRRKKQYSTHTHERHWKELICFILKENKTSCDKKKKKEKDLLRCLLGKPVALEKVESDFIAHAGAELLLHRWVSVNGSGVRPLKKK